jgi:urease accessory protein
MSERLVRIEKRLSSRAHLSQVLLKRAERLPLGFEDRRRSRLRARLSSGEEVALFLAHGTVLRDQDVLVASDGRLVCVEAEHEAVLEVTHADPAVLQRIAYHLGNRHVPVQLGATRLVLASDNVLADLIRQLGGVVNQVHAAFEPESGAYGGGHRHGHADTFSEDDALAKASFAVHWGEAGAPADASAALHEAHGATERHRHEHGHGHAHDHLHEHAAQKPHEH